MKGRGTASREIVLALSEITEGSSRQAIMTIGEVSSTLDLTPRAIRFYESAGLVAPRRSGRFRLYTTVDLGRLRLVKLFRSWGAEVDAIRIMLEGLGEVGSKAAFLQEISLAVREQAAKLNETISVASQSLEDCHSTIEQLDQMN